MKWEDEEGRRRGNRGGDARRSCMQISLVHLRGIGGGLTGRLAWKARRRKAWRILSPSQESILRLRQRISLSLSLPLVSVSQFQVSLSFVSLSHSFSYPSSLSLLCLDPFRAALAQPNKRVDRVYSRGSVRFWAPRKREKIGISVLHSCPLLFPFYSLFSTAKDCRN